MRMRWLARLLLPIAKKIADHVPPDFTVFKVEEGGVTYLKRWFVVKDDTVRNWRLYLHEMLKDDDAARHTHPYWSVSLILADGLVEVWDPHPPSLEPVIRFPRAGDIVFRSSSMAHQLIVQEGTRPLTLFLSGPRQEKGWGFWCSERYVPFEKYTARVEGAGGAGTGTSGVGVGCGEE